MKLLLIGLAAIAGAIATDASAADLPSMVPPPAVVPPTPGCAWCGWYVGINGGGAWDAGSTTRFFGNAATAPFFANNEFPTALTPDPSGAVGGGQIGYNWQVTPNILLGLEADLQASGYQGTATAAPVPTAPYVPFITSVQQHSDWFGTIRGRAGFLATPNLLVYGTGGLAVGQTAVSMSAIATGYTLATCPGDYTCVSGTSSATHVGWTAGGGLEWMVTPHFSIKAEYLFVDLGSQSVSATSAGTYTFTASAPFHEQVARLGVDWHF